MNSSRALALLCAWKGSFPGLRRRQPAQRVPPTEVLKHPCPGRLPCHLRPQRSSTAPQMARVIAMRRRLSSNLLALRMSRFRGVQVDLVNVPNFCVKRALNLYVSSAESARARNSKSEGVFDGAYGEPSEVSRKLRADRAPGRRFGFGANPQKPFRI